MAAPTRDDLDTLPAFKRARTLWATNVVVSKVSGLGVLAATIWGLLWLLAGWSGIGALVLLGVGILAANAAHSLRQRSLRSIAEAIGLSGVPLEMSVWGEVRVAKQAVQRADAWHEQRYGGKGEEELQRLAKEDAEMRRELEEWDKEQGR